MPPSVLYPPCNSVTGLRLLRSCQLLYFQNMALWPKAKCTGKCNGDGRRINYRVKSATCPYRIDHFLSLQRKHNNARQCSLPVDTIWLPSERCVCRAFPLVVRMNSAVYSFPRSVCGQCSDVQNTHQNNMYRAGSWHRMAVFTRSLLSPVGNEPHDPWPR